MLTFIAYLPAYSWRLTHSKEGLSFDSPPSSLLSPNLLSYLCITIFVSLLLSSTGKPSTSQNLPLFTSNKSPASNSREPVTLEKTPVHHSMTAAVMDRGERWGPAGQRRAESPPDNRVESLALRGSCGQMTLSSCEEVWVLLCSQHPLYFLNQLQGRVIMVLFYVASWCSSGKTP